MNRTTLSVLIGFGLCALAAARLDAYVATGVWIGFGVGAGLGLFNVLWQRHKLRVDPRQVMGAMVLGFLVKLTGALLGALALRFLEPLPGIADWRGYLVAFACAGFLTLVAGSLDNAREMNRETAH